MADEMLVMLREHGMHPDASFLGLIERYAAGEAGLAELTTALDRLWARGPARAEPPHRPPGQPAAG